MYPSHILLLLFLLSSYLTSSQVCKDYWAGTVPGCHGTCDIRTRVAIRQHKNRISDACMCLAPLQLEARNLHRPILRCHSRTIWLDQPVYQIVFFHCRGGSRLFSPTNLSIISPIIRLVAVVSSYSAAQNAHFWTREHRKPPKLRWN